MTTNQGGTSLHLPSEFKTNQTTFIIIQSEALRDVWNSSSEYAVASCGLNCSGLGNVYGDLDNGSSVASPESNVTEEYYKLVKQPVFMLVILSVSYGIVFLLALLGNISVIIVVAKDKSLHTATNLFLVNMAIADTLMAIFCLPITLLSNIYTGWQFGAIMCKAVPYLQGVAVCASVCTLVVIAVDRYIAICHVMRQRNTKRMARTILIIIWLLAMTLMTPWALFYKHLEYRTSLQLIYVCLPDFPDQTQSRVFFLAVIFLVCYALPLTFIVACYTMIGYRVCHRNAPGITSSKGVIQKSKIRVVKMLVVVVVLFAFSWMPLYIINLMMNFFPPPSRSAEMDVIQKILIPFAQWLGTSNSCMNPLVYCLFSQKIRRRIKALLCCSSVEFLNAGPNAMGGVRWSSRRMEINSTMEAHSRKTSFSSSSGSQYSSFFIHRSVGGLCHDPGDRVKKSSTRV